MKRHLISHTGKHSLEKNASSSNLIETDFSDSHVLPFECTICSEKFHNMSAGRRHSKRNHEGKAQMKFVSCSELEKLAAMALRKLDPCDKDCKPVPKSPNQPRIKVKKKRKPVFMDDVSEEDVEYKEEEIQVETVAAVESIDIVKVEIPANQAAVAIEEYQPQIQVTTDDQGRPTHHVIATPSQIYYQQM